MPDPNPQTTTTPAPQTQVIETQGGNPAPWYAGFKSPELKALVEGKKFASAEIMAESYGNLQKMFTTPPDKMITIPENYSDNEAWMQVFNKAGRPEKPEGYSIPKPENGAMDEAFEKVAREMFHKSGLTTKQVENLVPMWNAHVAKITADTEAAHAAELKKQDDALKAEWGSNFQEKVKHTSEFVLKAGISQEDIDQLQAVVGMGKTMKFFDFLAKKSGEPDFVSAGGAGGKRDLTSEEAAAKIKFNKLDPVFSKRWMAGEPSALKEMDELYKKVYPGEAAIKQTMVAG